MAQWQMDIFKMWNFGKENILALDLLEFNRVWEI